MKKRTIISGFCLLFACVPPNKHKAGTPRATSDAVQGQGDVQSPNEVPADPLASGTPVPTPTGAAPVSKVQKFDKQSCEKNPVTGVCFTVDATLNELSGIVPHSKVQNVFWVHNDEGPGIIYALNNKGEILVNLTLAGITLLDSEDISSGPGPTANTNFIYLGDVGSKGKTAGTIFVVRFPEPNVDPLVKALNVAAANVDRLTLTYPGALLDFETMFIDPIDGHLYVVQKGGFNVFKADKTQLNAAVNGGTVPMTLVRTTGSWANEPSAGNVSPGGDEIVIRNETMAWIFRRAAGQKIEDALGTVPVTIPLGPEFNGEAIAFDNKGIDLVTVSENQSKAANATSPPQPVFYYKRLP